MSRYQEQEVLQIIERFYSPIIFKNTDGVAPPPPLSDKDQKIQRKLQLIQFKKDKKNRNRRGQQNEGEEGPSDLSYNGFDPHLTDTQHAKLGQSLMEFRLKANRNRQFYRNGFKPLFINFISQLGLSLRNEFLLAVVINSYGWPESVQVAHSILAGEYQLRSRGDDDGSDYDEEIPSREEIFEDENLDPKLKRFFAIGNRHCYRSIPSTASHCKSLWYIIATHSLSWTPFHQVLPFSVVMCCEKFRRALVMKMVCPLVDDDNDDNDPQYSRTKPYSPLQLLLIKGWAWPLHAVVRYGVDIGVEYQRLDRKEQRTAWKNLFDSITHQYCFLKHPEDGVFTLPPSIVVDFKQLYIDIIEKFQSSAIDGTVDVEKIDQNDQNEENDGKSAKNDKYEKKPTFTYISPLTPSFFFNQVYPRLKPFNHFDEYIHPLVDALTRGAYPVVEYLLSKGCTIPLYTHGCKIHYFHSIRDYEFHNAAGNDRKRKDMENGPEDEEGEEEEQPQQDEEQQDDDNHEEEEEEQQPTESNQNDLDDDFSDLLTERQYSKAHEDSLSKPLLPIFMIINFVHIPILPFQYPLYNNLMDWVLENVNGAKDLMDYEVKRSSHIGGNGVVVVGCGDVGTDNIHNNNNISSSFTPYPLSNYKSLPHLKYNLITQAFLHGNHVAAEYLWNKGMRFEHQLDTIPMAEFQYYATMGSDSFSHRYYTPTLAWLMGKVNDFHQLDQGKQNNQVVDTNDNNVDDNDNNNNNNNINGLGTKNPFNVNDFWQNTMNSPLPYKYFKYDRDPSNRGSFYTKNPVLFAATLQSEMINALVLGGGKNNRANLLVRFDGQRYLKKPSKLHSFTPLMIAITENELPYCDDETGEELEEDWGFMHVNTIIQGFLLSLLDGTEDLDHYDVYPPSHEEVTIRAGGVEYECYPN